MTAPTFGCGEADVIISVGYELQESGPARISPGRGKQILHLRRLPAEADASCDAEAGSGPASPLP